MSARAVPQPADRHSGAKALPVRPDTVRYALWLWVASATLGAVGVISLLVHFDEAKADALEAIAQGGSTFTAVEAQSAANFGIVVGLVGQVVLIGLQLAFAAAMFAGKDWARLVLSFLGAVVLVLTLPGLWATSAGTQALAAVHCVVLIGGLALLFVRSTVAWFRPIESEL